MNQKVLKKQLVKLGYEVQIANHGVEALDFLATTKHARSRQEDGVELSVVLMDLEMPVMNGLECVARIRTLQREGAFVQHIPVIAITANARTEQIKQAIEAGMDEVVPKPFRVPELVARIEMVLVGVRNRTDSSSSDLGSNESLIG